MPLDSYSDDDLLSSLQHGDVQAFEVIYYRFWKPLYVHAYARLNETDLAEEFVQDIFVQLWDNRKKIVVEVSLKAYLHGSIKNRILRHFRDQYRHEEHHDEIRKHTLQSSNQAERSIIQKDLLDKIELLIQNLPNRSREVFELSRKQFLSNKEIACRLGVTDKTVEYHINYAIQYLKTNCPDNLYILLLVYGYMN